LLPPQRQQLALEALAGHSVSALAQEHQVSRKFIYQHRMVFSAILVNFLNRRSILAVSPEVMEAMP